MTRESMEFDVVIVGGGPGGLAAACRLMQLSQKSGHEISVCVIEKGSEIGAHILSGAVFEPRALNELFPDWRERGAPLNTPVTEDDVYYLVNDTNGIRVPSLLVPKATHNHGNYAISLGNLCRWLGEQAEALGVNIFPGFAGAEVLYNADGSVRGVATGDMGVAADGSHKPTYQAGYELIGKYTIFAEGCRGNLGKQLIKKFDLDRGAATQHYAIGLKELWDLDPEKHVPGKVVHAMGWPLNHLPRRIFRRIFVSPRKFPGCRRLDHRSRLQKSAPEPVRRIPALQTSPADRQIPRGRQARLLRRARDRQRRPAGVAEARLSGRVADRRRRRFSEHAEDQRQSHRDEVRDARGRSGVRRAREWRDRRHGTDRFPEAFKNSWLYNELYEARNAGPAIHKFGTFFGSAFAWIDQTFFRGRAPFTLSDPVPDYATLVKAADAKRIDYPKPDNVLSFDKLSSVFLSNTNHAEDQPCHLKLTDPTIPIARNLPDYDEPAQRYCPAGGLRSGDREWVAAVSDQFAELRALQDLRHQGSRAEHHVGGAGGDRRAELSEHVVRRLCSRVQRVSSSKNTPLLHTPYDPSGPVVASSASR